MHTMGLEAVYSKPGLNRKGTEHKVYPYLLRGMEIDSPDQVWASDIIYVYRFFP